MNHQIGTKMREDSDVELLARVVEGDVEAWATLYERHSDRCAQIAVRLLGDAEAAQDVVQDVFVSAWRRAGTYSPGRGTVRAWLAVQSRSRAFDRHRRAHARRNAYRRMPSRETTYELESWADHGRVTDALRGLPTPQRDVLELGYWHGLSSTEIAAHRGIPVGTVKSRTASGLRRLRQAFT